MSWSDFPVDADKAKEARALARRIAEDVQRFINHHTTVSIERTVLRALGFSAVDGSGTPVVNQVVDEIARRGQLAAGAASWLAHAMKRTDRGPAELCAMIASSGLSGELFPGREETVEGPPRDRVVALTREAIADIRRRVDARDALRNEVGVGSTPLKYVIVATGDIFDDVRQAVAAAQAGADIVAVIRSTAQSLLDYVPHGATREGYGGTYATQENFRIMREALDAEGRRLKRYIALTNYSSGLCMPEIAFMGAVERLDYLLNDAMYGILFRDINMKRTFVDQYFSRRICALARIGIMTGEDNYLTTAPALTAFHTVVASEFINEAFALLAGLPASLIGLGHAFEIDPAVPDSLLLEIGQALLVRRLFPDAPIKYMPPTKHMPGDIFMGYLFDGMFNLVGVATGQTVQLLGMHTEAIHNPFLMDRYLSLKNADYVFRAARSLGQEVRWAADGIVVSRARSVLAQAVELLREIAERGLMATISEGKFAEVKRQPDGGKGLGGVVERGPGYFNPLLEQLESRES